MFSIRFIGVGSAFTTREYYQSNALIIAPSGRKLLIDCGSQAQFALEELGINNGNVGSEIDGVYISHLHADHVGSLEWLALVTYFNPAFPRPRLFAVPTLLRELWQKSLRGGLETLEGKIANLTDFFDCHPVRINSCFHWEGLRFTPFQTVHVVSGMKIQHSYGLIISEPAAKQRVLFTTDTQFAPYQMRKLYDSADLIFHDCETALFKSGVHAHYDDLRSLPDPIRRKMWLYHYQPSPRQKPVDDGFLGFVAKGQEFTVGSVPLAPSAAA
ncbi:MAG TPA: MBL fold metallo-hydrolase [Candidatus Ozemobacteraceae bacterium]